MNNKIVNICVVTFNRIEFTIQSLPSIIDTVDYKSIITVVDNCSGDGTVEYLKDLYNKKRIDNLFLLNENIGLAKASNLAWKYFEEAEYYIRIDNDIIMRKSNWLSGMVDVLENAPEIGLLGYNLETRSYPIEEIRGYKLRVKRVGNVGGGCIMIPKRTSDKLGYWCEEYGLYGEEDYDYNVRVGLSGLLNAYMEDEDACFHLPSGKAAAIDVKTFEASDGIEENIHSEYRKWKDEQRRKIAGENGIVRANVKKYKSGEKPLRCESNISENFFLMKY